MAASRTAEYVAMYRALETNERRREPLFRDPLATRFLTGSRALAIRLANVPGCREVLERYSDRRAPGARTSAIGRTRFIDDAIRAEIARGTRQVVILGAGYDTRAHRMPELATSTVFEVDRPETQAAKRDRIGDPTAGDQLISETTSRSISDRWRELRRRGEAISRMANHGWRVFRGSEAEFTSSPSTNVRYVAVNFERDDLSRALSAAGFARDQPAVFIWEGVTNYLDEAAVSAVLDLIGKTAPGSALVFTYIHKGVIDGTKHFEGANVLVESVKQLGEPWRFGLLPSEVGDFVTKFGLALEQDLGADEYRAKYQVNAPGYAFYRVAIARVN